MLKIFFWTAAITLALSLLGLWGRNRAARDVSSLPMLAGDDEFDFDIVGEASYQSSLESVVGSEPGYEHLCRAVLVPEPLNRYDRHAIRVDISGLTVGYISRDDTHVLHPVLCGMPAAVDAVIIGGWRRPGAGGKFGVRLDLALPPRFS